MPQHFPRDRFDSIPRGVERVGAHRAPKRRGSGWIAFGWAVLATVVLAGGGIFAVMAYNGRFDEAAPPPSDEAPPVTAEPTLSPDIPVTVLNGTTVSGLAAQAGAALTAVGIPVGATSNASENDVQETVVYYVTPDLEGAARGVAQQLPEAEVRMSADFEAIGSQLVVVLGQDYATSTGAAG